MKENDMPHQPTKRKAHQHRDDLAGEHKAGDAGQFILACSFFAVWIADTFFFKYTIFLNQHVPLGVRIPVGIVLLLLAGYLAARGHSIVFGKEKQKPEVINEGVFSIVRHPMYLSELLLYLGLLMLSLSLAAAFVWVIAIGFLHYISRYEEKLLIARFGADYERYMREVAMWIPLLRKR